jgi:hypothetical protein
MNFKFQIPNFKAAWSWLRQVTGDAAYDSYLRSRQRQTCAAGHRHGVSGHSVGCGHPLSDSGLQSPVLTREEFYLDSLRRRYSGVSRCC